MNENNTYKDHLFEFRNVARKKLILSLVITTIIMGVEFAGGLLTRSIALISDAGHMFTHSFAIAISLLASTLAARPPCHHRTFGLLRAEVLAAFVNGLFLVLVVIVIMTEAVERMLNPREILSSQMLLVALIGLITNLVSIWILHGSHHHDLNIRGVFFHMVADAASSVGIVIAAIIIHYTGWTLIDPLVSVGISIVILVWAWGILKESTRVLLEISPRGLDSDTISQELMQKFPEISDLSNVHLWVIIPGMWVFSAHIHITEQNDGLATRINQFLEENFKIIESTIQIVISSEDRTSVC